MIHLLLFLLYNIVLYLIKRQITYRLSFLPSFFKRLWLKKKLAIVPIVGLFPVKLKSVFLFYLFLFYTGNSFLYISNVLYFSYLRSFVGDPIYYDEFRSVEELVLIVMKLFDNIEYIFFHLMHYLFQRQKCKWKN